MLLAILMERKLLEFFTKKNYKKQIKKCLKLKKQSREKAINYILNGKDAVIWIDKKHSINE